MNIQDTVADQIVALFEGKEEVDKVEVYYNEAYIPSVVHVLYVDGEHVEISVEKIYDENLTKQVF